MAYLLQPDLFDIAEIERVNQEIKEKQHTIAVKQAQATMQLPYFDKPKNDNELLLNLQYEYIKNNNQAKWGELLMLSYKVIKRLIWRKLANKEIGFLDDIEQEEKASIALYYVMRRYKTRIGYYVQKNYISFLDCGVKHALKYTTKLDQNTISYEAYLENNAEKELKK